jgi:hypothetical protein
MADRIAAKSRHARDAIRHFGTADRAQGEDVIKSEREIARRDEERGEQNVQRFRLLDRFEDVVRVDAVQQPEKNVERNAGDRKADQHADAMPVHPFTQKTIDRSPRALHSAP